LLTEKAAVIEKTIAVKDHGRERHAFDTTMCNENRFWNQRPDGTGINKHHRTLYILEFKRSSGRNKDFLGTKEDEANEQHKHSSIEALKAAAQEWMFEPINFVEGTRTHGAVVEDDFYNKLERHNVQAGRRDKTQVLAAHVQRIYKKHDTVLRIASNSTISKYMSRLGLPRQRRWTTLENNVCVNSSQSLCQQLLKKGEGGAKLD